GQQYTAATGRAQRPANRDDERREVIAHRFTHHHAPPPQLIDESALQVVGRHIDGVSIIIWDVAYADVDVVALGKNVRITFGRADIGLAPPALPARPACPALCWRMSIRNPPRWRIDVAQSGAPPFPPY